MITHESPGVAAHRPLPAPFHQHVFVGGLHRSGTTLVGQAIAGHSRASGFEDTGVIENEGQFLQSVYPIMRNPPRIYPWADWTGLPDRVGWWRRLPGRGGSDWKKAPGRFAFYEESHLTGDSPLVNDLNRERLLREWSAHWDLRRPVLVEKTPENLVRSRFLQALFPGAAFIMVVRHPLAVSLATQKWSRTSLISLLKHWIRAHQLMAVDAAHIDRLLLVPYERFVLDPTAELARIAGFLGVDPEPSTVEVDPAVNARYLDAWERRRRGPARIYTDFIVRTLESQVSEFGYSLRTPASMDWARLDALNR